MAWRARRVGRVAGIWAIGAIAAVAGSLAWAGFAKGRDDRERLADHGQREIRDQMTLEGSSCVLSIDDLAGSIQVVPGSAGRIEFIARERVRARDAAAAERARQEVKLEVTKRPGGLTLYVDGPFRCGWIDGRRRGEDCGGRHRQDYLVVYDFEVRVPPRCDLDLSTVIDGDVRVRGIEGTARARAVNGSVHLEQMRGEIDAATVNDDVRVEMAAAPTGSLHLETVNGDAELVTPQLDADLELETMNGEMWSDFPFVAAPGAAARVEKKGSRNVIRIDDGVVIRIGSPTRDAPRHRLETLNGDVLIRRTKP